MQIHELIQGTPEWHAYRAEHDNASDAPAMMGASTYKSREQLIAERATGVVPEVDAATQRLFDSGHRFERLARPVAEALLGEELSPVTVSNGRLSASFDGITLMDDVAFEHKRLNARLRAALSTPGCTGADLPMEYQIQMEQQCAVAGCEKVLFMATSWADDDTLIEEMHCWYFPNLELRARIVAGWEQFHKDVAAYKPGAAAAAPVVGRTPENLPALLIQVSGAITASNLPEFKEAALAVLGGINRDLRTDQDFATAESTVKWCGDVESRLAAAKAHALSQTATIEEVFRAIDEISAEARRVRLDLDKLVKARKEEIRGEIVAGGIAAFREHIAALNARLGKPYMPAVPADFNGVIKGKRTVESLRGAVNDELARAKIAANEVADKIQVNLTTLRELASAHAFLFADTPTIVLKAPDDLKTLVNARIREHEAARVAEEEARRERIRAEEVAKVQRAQKEEDDLISSIWEAARRIEGPRVGYVQKAIGYFESGPCKYIDDYRPRVVAEVIAARAEMQQKLREAQDREARDREEYEAREELVQQEVAAQAAIAQAKATEQLAAPLADDLSTLAREKTQEAVAGIDAGQAISQAQRAAAAGPAVVPLRAAPAPTSQPTLKLGEIEKRLGFPLSAAFLFILGFQPAAKVGAHGVYHEAQFPQMLAALVRHIEGVQAKAAA